MPKPYRHHTQCERDYKDFQRRSGSRRWERGDVPSADAQKYNGVRAVEGTGGGQGSAPGTPWIESVGILRASCGHPIPQITLRERSAHVRTGAQTPRCRVSERKTISVVTRRRYALKTQVP